MCSRTGSAVRSSFRRMPGRRNARRAPPRWLARFPVLRNVVDARYAEAIRWLRWLGFRFGEPVNIGVAGLPFLPFQMEAADV